MSNPATSANRTERLDVGPDIPVTVIGGYLGSGKTTLVNHLLAAGIERVAVLVNDFGDVDIDASLIERASGDTIALANGCICCSLVDGLAAALATVAKLDPAPDRLVIEASGVADPASVAAYGHGPGFRLDAVVVLVDAETVRQRAGDKYVGDTVLGQLRSADIVVLNKVDLVTPEAVDEVTQWLDDRIDRAVLVTASQASVDPAVLFGTVDRAQSSAAAPPGASEASPAHGLAEDVYQSWSWTGDEPIGRADLERLMADIPDSIVRAKGIVWLADDPERPQVLQRVGGRWTIRPGPPQTDGRSRLVLIGRRGAIGDGWLADRLAG